MFKRLIGIIMVILLMLSVFAGCGAKGEESIAAPSMAVQRAAPSNDNVTVTFNESMDAKEDGAKDYGNGITTTETDKLATAAAEAPAATAGPGSAPLADSLAGTGNTIEDVSNAILSDRKIIFSASLTIEVENFDEAYNRINSIIMGIGIVQQLNSSTEKIFVDEKPKLIKRGTIVLRVNKDKFDSVIGSLNGIGEVYNKQINGQDVTGQFIDTESKVRLLKIEQSRLEALLIKMEDLDQIFRTESRLTEIRQNIESLTGSLNKMKSLVEDSTITLTINEKYPDSDKQPKPVTYGQKLLNSLKSSIEGAVKFLGDLLIIIIAALPILILLGLFVLLVLFIYRRIPRKNKVSANVVKNSIEEKKDDQQ
jgi:predicted small lipoprotein YifL